MGLPKHRPELPRRCRWRDGQGVRCPRLQEPELTCCLPHRCQGSRSCPRRAMDGRITCRNHRQLENRLRHREQLGAIGKTSGREPPGPLLLPSLSPTWQELCDRWARAHSARAPSKVHGPRPAVRPLKPRDSALTCAWCDDTGTRCRKPALSPRSYCEQHRCQGSPDCTLRARNGTTLCRNHRRLAGTRRPPPPASPQVTGPPSQPGEQPPPPLT